MLGQWLWPKYNFLDPMLQCNYNSGFFCDGLFPNSRVTGLQLNSRETSWLIRGPIPDSLGQLRGLTFLYLDDNELEGSIPASLGNLLDLDILHIQNNFLVSYISVESFSCVTFNYSYYCY